MVTHTRVYTTPPMHQHAPSQRGPTLAHTAFETLTSELLKVGDSSTCHQFFLFLLFFPSSFPSF